MFKKKPTIKPLAPLRSSDRRKIADQIIKDFHVDLPAQSTVEGAEPEAQAQADSSASLSSIRNDLLPENTQSARFTTTAGPDLKTVSGTVYVGAQAGHEQRILWLKTEDKMYPTVYTLWHNPRLVPLLHTPSIVLQKLRGGADLMTPGLARGPPFPAAAVSGSVAAVASLEKPSVPVWVGICDIDVAALGNVRGEKGRAVRGVHWEGDELWGWSAGGQPGGAAPEHIDGWDSGKADDATGVEEDLDDLDINDDEHGRDEDGGVTLGGAREEQSGDKTRNDFVEGEEGGLLEAVQVEEKEMSVKEIDDAFRKAFLYGVHRHKTANTGTPGYGLSFPLTSSSFMSDLVLPFLPTFTPAQTASLQMKKTSWKNLKKFIKVLDKQRLLKAKDRNGGETVVTDIDFEDRAVVEFVPYPLPRKEPAGSGEGVGGKEAADGQAGDPAVGQHLKRLILYRPRDKLAPIFEAAKRSLKAMYLPAEIREIVTIYVEAESLVSPTSKRQVKLDPVLANAVYDGKQTKDKEVVAKGSAPRESLVERVLQNCSPSYVILRADESKDDVRAKSGAPPAVHIVMETRMGNKTVTRVSGVEAYHINPQPLAEELQKTCASSTSVGQLVGSSPKAPVMEIMVQGPQSAAVTKALERRGVRQEWVEVTDKTKGKKR